MRLVNKISSLILFLLLINSSGAQQLTQYSHYFINPFIINPALTGQTGYTNAFFFRNQKNIGFKGGAVSNLLTIDGGAFDNKVGLGFTLMSDQMGPLSTQGGFLSAAYRVKFTDDIRLGFGFSGGIADRRFDLANAVVQDPNDPMLSMGFPARKTYFDGTAGLNLDVKKFQFGIAVPQILASKLSLDSSSTRLARHYTSHLMYDYVINEIKEISIIPMARVMYVPGAPIQYDVNARVDMKRLGWLNVAWRSNYAVSGSLGVRIKESIQAGYAYHYVMNTGKNYGASQHEIVLGISFGAGGKRDQARIDALQAEIDRLKAENEKLQREKDSLMILKTKAEVELREQKEKEQKLIDSISALNSKIDELYAENKLLKEENENLKKQLEELKNKGATTITVPDPKTEEENKRLKKEIEDLKKQIEELKNKGATTVTVPDPNTEEENKRLRKENEDLRKQLEELKKRPVSTENKTENKTEVTPPNTDIRKSTSDDHFYEADKSTDSPKGYYVVSGAFGSEQNALNWMSQMKDEFKNSRLIYNTRNNLHYIIIGYSTDKSEVFGIHTSGKNAGIEKIWILDYN